MLQPRRSPARPDPTRPDPTRPDPTRPARPGAQHPPGPTGQLTRRDLLRRGVGLPLGVAALAGLNTACGGPAGLDSGGGGGGGSTSRWRIGTPEIKGDTVFQAMGIEQGFFEEEGLQAELVPIESGATTVRAVISGDLEFGTGGPGPMLAAMGSGADLKFLGTVLGKVPHLLYVHKDVQTLEDLVGQTVGGGQTGSLLQQLAYAVFQEQGVDPDSVEYVNSGGSPDVFAAVVGGNVRAGVAGPEYVLELEADPSIPVKVLLNISDVLPDYLRNADIVSGRLISDDPDLVARAVAAYARGARYALDHPDEAVAWMTANADLDEETATTVLQDYADRGLVNEEYEILPQRLEYTQQVNVDTGAQDEVLDPADIVATDVVAEILSLAT